VSNGQPANYIELLGDEAREVASTEDELTKGVAARYHSKDSTPVCLRAQE
jgi:hypothetical protein